MLRQITYILFGKTATERRLEFAYQEFANLTDEKRENILELINLGSDNQSLSEIPYEKHNTTLDLISMVADQINRYK